jgi:hypothetical protein
MDGWHERMGLRARVLQAPATWPSSNRRWDANEAASYGMDLTTPLMDKRVVEFGLAIPPKLEVKNGRERDLACRALGEVYPLEFQARARGQDWLEPDLAGMLDACRPAVHAEIKRLAPRPAVAKFFDFERMEQQLAPGPGTQKRLAETTHALRALVAAEYVAWFAGDNR